MINRILSLRGAETANGWSSSGEMGGVFHLSTCAETCHSQAASEMRPNFRFVMWQKNWGEPEERNG